MIGKLTGLVDSTGDDWAILEVSGVGYIAFCSSRTLDRIQGRRDPVSLLIETHVREDHIHLFGFIDQGERDWFRLLSTVQGVGTKMALALLSALPPQELVQAIAAQDKASLTRANGIGPRLAARIVTELKDKAGALEFGHLAVTPASGRADPGASDDLRSTVEDAVSALVNLGYRRSEAFGAVAQAANRLGGDSALEALIKEGLKELSA